MHVCICVYIFTLIFGYLIRISFIPQIGKLYNGKNKIWFDSPLQGNKMKHGTSSFKKPNTMNVFLLLTTHTFIKSHTKQIKSNRMILNKLFLISWKISFLSFMNYMLYFCNDGVQQQFHRYHNRCPIVLFLL